MKTINLRNELKNEGYSKEEQYFYELNHRLKNELKTEERQEEDLVKKDERFKEKALQRWESEGGSIKNKAS